MHKRQEEKKYKKNPTWLHIHIQRTSMETDKQACSLISETDALTCIGFHTY